MEREGGEKGRNKWEEERREGGRGRGRKGNRNGKEKVKVLELCCSVS